MSNPETTGVAVVTGASRGIGREIARTLAAAGHPVAALARSEGDLEEIVALTEQAGTRATSFVVDVTDHEQVERVVADIEGRMGAIDLLVEQKDLRNDKSIIHFVRNRWDSPHHWIGVRLRRASRGPSPLGTPRRRRLRGSGPGPSRSTGG